MSILSFDFRTRRVLKVSVVAITASLLAGCSSTMSRFNFPVFGLNETENKSQPTSAYAGATSYGSQSYLNSQGDTRSTTDYTPSYSNPRNYGADSAAITRAPIDPVQRPNYQVDTIQNRGATNPNRVASIDTKPSYGLDSYGRNNTSSDFGSSGLSPEPATSAGQGQRITVRSGDTLYNLSKKYGVPVTSIKAANQLDRNNIRTGQVLLIPAKGYAGGDVYRVRSGDTIHSIAQRYGVSASELAAYNRLSNPRNLKVGQLLRMPDDAVRLSHDPETMPAVRSVRTQKIPVERQQPTSNRRVASIAKNDLVVSSKTSEDASRKSGGQRVAGIGPLPKPQGQSRSQSDDKFRWPVRGRIISEFGPKSSGAHNDGVNLAVPMGTSVKAAQNGVVAYSGNELKGYGNLILIRHANNWVSAYAHNSELLVKRGDKILRGQVIAKSGKSGSVGQPQLHFELRKASKPIDPVQHMEPL